MRQITEIGCIACYVMGVAGTPGAVHHLIEGARRRGHLYTICLCDPGHHQNPQPGSGKVPRHPSKRAFENAYGSELSLLEKTRELVLKKRERERVTA